jgi:hypothetical protein
MKPTAQLLGLLFATLAVTALAAETPAAPATEATAPALSPSNGPAATPPTEPVKAEPAVPAVATPPTAVIPFSPLASGKVDDPPADPDVLELPKMVVKQKPRPRLTPEIMVVKQAFGEELARQKFSQLDQLLNKFTLPLFGSSLAERALDEHEREKKQEMKLDVLNMVQALETADPTEAKSLKEAATRP